MKFTYIRELGGEKFSYASDYEIVTRLKKFSNKHRICLLVVHHTLKQGAEDCFDTISGTNGLLGAASELAALLGGLELKPNALSRRLNVGVNRLLSEYGVSYECSCSHTGRQIWLTLASDRASPSSRRSLSGVQGALFKGLRYFRRK